MEIHFSHVLGTLCIGASYEKFKKPLTLKCFCSQIVPISLTIGIHFSHILEILWISV